MVIGASVSQPQFKNGAGQIFGLFNSKVQARALRHHAIYEQVKAGHVLFLIFHRRDLAGGHPIRTLDA
jgi:hypothetical protein